jgi:ABC-type transport system involved in multi-copper enzyme maturation permease subunit
MLSVLLWKEYREHRIVWAALAFVAAASLLFLPFVMAPGGLEGQPDVRNALRTLIIVLSWTYGLICGAMLLAGEREVGTLSFLDALPGLRWRLWLAKCLAGLLLVATQIVLLMIVATATHLFASGAEAVWTLNGMVWSGLYGFAWGMLFSSFGRSVMNMILLALAAQFAAVFVTSLLAGFLAALAMLASGKPAGDDAIRFWGPVGASVALLSIAPALAGSAFLFTRLDRGRLQPLRTITVRPRKPRSPGWLVLFWLTWRQARGFALGMAIFALVTGFLIPLLGPLVWPVATLVVGILCGATAFDDEQQGPFRYLGDQRLPLFRVWIVKVGVRLGIALTAATIMMMPLFPFVLFYSQVFSRAFAGLVTTCGPVLFLTMGLVYGFCVGVLCGLLFRSILASVLFASILSLLLALIWLPSLLASGLLAWQPLGPPILLLASTPFLLRPWAAGRIASWTTAARLTPFVVLIGLWIAGGLWYRVLEIPNVPEQVDLEAFRATLPTEKDNQAGELVRRACVNFGDLYRKFYDERSREVHPGVAQAPLRLDERAENVLDHGWSGDDPELAAWLNKIIAGEWVGMLKETADMPPGMVEDMRNLTNWSRQPVAENSQRITISLAARGLQRQASGDDATFVQNLRIALGLSLAMRHRAPPLDVYCGRESEVLLLKALDRWLERLHGRPDLLHQALDVLSQYVDAPKGDDEMDLMDDLTIMNMVNDPIPWLKYSLTFTGDARIDDQDAQMEAQWVATSWLAPWEHERQQRILRVLFWGDEKQRKDLGPFKTGPLWWYVHMRGKPNKLTSVALARAGILKLALRWYQMDNGKPAETLDELVPKYLPSIPIDPFDYYGKQPFHYRLSRGEEIEWPPDPLPSGGTIPPAAEAAPSTPTRKITPGQGILWSNGEDKIDDGGHRQTGWYDGQRRDLGVFYDKQDIIYLVPLPAKGK